MSTTEIVIALAGLYLGYWIVSKLIMDKPKVMAQPEYHSTSAASEQDLVNSTAPQTWYDVLQVEPHASAAEIRRSYRTLMGQYHPDKVATLGDELKRVSERKTKEINIAYEDAMRERGEHA
jgi:DnaJ-domain-containing protein 1